MSHSNQKILTDFLEAICRVVSEGTSDTYATMVITKFDKSIRTKFPFVKYIHLKSNKIDVSEKVNSVSPEFIGKFIKKLIDSLFSDLFKRLIRRNMGIILLEDLKKLGVKM